MRIRFWGVWVPWIAAMAGIAVLVLAGQIVLRAQARGAAQGARGQAPAAPAYRAPRAPGTANPNLNGVWQALNEANWDIEAHAAGFGRVVALGAVDAVPPGLGVVEGGPIP